MLERMSGAHCKRFLEYFCTLLRFMNIKTVIMKAYSKSSIEFGKCSSAQWNVKFKEIDADRNNVILKIIKLSSILMSYKYTQFYWASKKAFLVFSPGYPLKSRRTCIENIVLYKEDFE